MGMLIRVFMIMGVGMFMCVLLPPVGMGMGMNMSVLMGMSVLVRVCAFHQSSLTWAVLVSFENLTPLRPPISVVIRSMSSGVPWMKMVSRQLW
jgi:hypothetical protein